MKIKIFVAAAVAAAWLVMQATGFAASPEESVSTYVKWEAAGRVAATRALEMLGNTGAAPSKDKLIVLSNAGFAEVNGEGVSGALDGLAAVTVASRGRNTLLEIHSAAWSPLWFALYDKDSGRCAYLEVDPCEAAKMTLGKTPAGLFLVAATERIDAGYLFRHSAQCRAKFEGKVFGGNEFRIVTIANVVAAGAPPDAVRAFEFHDHYCPGLTAGILMARYLRAHFPPGRSGYFVNAVEPWCKEDALMVLLNATPGKRSYAVSYPSKSDIARRVPETRNVSAIAYRENGQSGKWEGLALAFEWAETPCPASGNVIEERLCEDLRYLERMDRPEQYVKVVKRFELAKGSSPADWARPGVDPLQMPGPEITE